MKKHQIEKIASELRSRYPEKRKGIRKIGREAEYPIVDAKGNAADAMRILAGLSKGMDPVYDIPDRKQLLVGLKNKDYSYYLEVGLGTLEVISKPCENLQEVERVHDLAMTRFLEVAKGLRVLGFGIQPLTPPSEKIMVPKSRYVLLNQIIGKPWKHFTLTASDQVQIDLARDEVFPVTNLVNLLSPVWIALFGNSSITGGHAGEWISTREAEKRRDLYPNEFRHGMPQGPFRDFEHFVEVMAQKVCLVDRDGSQYYSVQKKFQDHYEARGEDMNAFWLHEHYIWLSGRIRAPYSTIEIRPSCQQPWNAHMGVSAFSLGLVEAHQEAAAYVQDCLGKDPWPVMHGYFGKVVREGLAAPEPVPGFIQNLVKIAREGLKGRGLEEERYIDVLDERIKKKMNPGQQAVKTLKEKGWAAALDELTYRLS